MNNPIAMTREHTPQGVIHASASCGCGERVQAAGAPLAAREMGEGGFTCL